jgi:hypothetical protein
MQSPEQASLTRLQESGYFATNHSLLEQNLRQSEEIRRLSEENKKLGIRVLELEERLNTNSSNSSKAPSQDSFRKPKHSLSSGRKPGGQLRMAQGFQVPRAGTKLTSL